MSEVTATIVGSFLSKRSPVWIRRRKTATHDFVELRINSNPITGERIDMTMRWSLKLISKGEGFDAAFKCLVDILHLEDSHALEVIRILMRHHYNWMGR